MNSVCVDSVCRWAIFGPSAGRDPRGTGDNNITGHYLGTGIILGSSNVKAYKTKVIPLNKKYRLLRTLQYPCILKENKKR